MAVEKQASHPDLRDSSLHRKMQLHCLTTVQTAIHKSASADQLRSCQRVYLGESNARRLLRRAQLVKRPGSDEYEDPIFSQHQDATAEAVAQMTTAAAVTPFDADVVVSGTGPSRVKTGYSVECYATHAEDEQRRKDALAVEKEKMVLFTSINSSRQAEGVHPLRLKTVLCKLAQDQADYSPTKQTTPPHPPNPPPNPASPPPAPPQTSATRIPSQ